MSLSLCLLGQNGVMRRGTMPSLVLISGYTQWEWFRHSAYKYPDSEFLTIQYCVCVIQWLCVTLWNDKQTNNNVIPPSHTHTHTQIHRYTHRYTHTLTLNFVIQSNMMLNSHLWFGGLHLKNTVDEASVTFSVTLWLTFRILGLCKLKEVLLVLLRYPPLV